MGDIGNTPTVLVVDDIDMNVMILEEILKDSYNVLTAGNGKEALAVLRKAEVLPKLILLDVLMPEMTGREMFDIMKADEALKRIPVIFITAENDSESELLAAGAVDFINKPFAQEIVKLRVRNQIELKNYSDSLEEMVAEKTAEATSTLDNTLQALANIIEYRNLESGSHVKRTQFFCKALIDYILEADLEYAAELRTMEPDIIVKSMALHDVGKIGIPDKILLKPGRLDQEEFEIMKTHTVVGRNIIEEMMKAVKDKDSIYLKHCRNIAWSHHERFDGKGYPQGLSGLDIPLAARIASLSDVYDALVCARVYKAALPYSDAIGIISEGRGAQFDPVLTDAVMQIQDKFQEISRKNQ
ncbi:two-component system response regulator [Spirochaetia bacterium]|nr:two-component system response regulator [Spirochaetia bacterium]GHV43240.1 two-component system response regulator [Spirochaetia bacterium]